MNYYEHHIGDWAEATAHLSLAEDGAYSRLVRKYYALETPLPADIKAVQRLVGARSKEERAAVETVLQEFFTLGEAGWRNARCDEELARYKEKQAKARSSANARWDRPDAHTNRNANAMRTHIKSDANALPTQSEGNALQSPIPRPQTPEPKSLSQQSERSYSESESAHAIEKVSRETFLAIQRRYPAGIYRQADWILAERNIAKLLGDGESGESLIEAAESYCDQQRAKASIGTQFVMNPAKFYGSDAWRGPFPVPKTKSETTQDANVAASLEWLRQQETGNAA